MKRHYYLLFILPLFLAACSSDNTTEKDQPKASAAVRTISQEAGKVEPAGMLPDPARPAEQRIALKQDLATMKVGDHFRLAPPVGKKYDIPITSRKESRNGIVTLTGDLDGTGRYKMVATVSKSGMFGRIETPETTYQITVKDGETVLIDLYAPGNIVVPRSEKDMIIPPPQRQPAVAQEQALLQSTGATPQTAEVMALADGKTTVDIMILYTPGVATKYPGDLLEGRLNYMVSLANTAYESSNINTNLRLVHHEVIDYSEFTNNDPALTALTNGTAPFGGVAALRQLHGADLVILMRPFDYQTHGGCGLAWVTGTNNSDFTGDVGYGFSVIGDGSDSGYYCTDLTMTHEIGHNLGSAHDRDHSSFAGAFPYSYGYGITGHFGTIMSYISPEVAYFSNPALTCGSLNEPCGVNENDPTSAANNTLSMNYSSPYISDFMHQRYVGDINNDGSVNLTDTIQALRVTVGESPANLDIYQDINGDGKIGIEEVIYSLQHQ